MIQVRERHLTSREVNSEVKAVLPRINTHRISDAAAVTIASWYQTPGGHGAVFASFASGCMVNKRDLMEAVAAESHLWETDPERGNLDQLRCLLMWATDQR